MIDIRQLAFGYANGEQLFRDLSLTLEAGNLYGLLGLNGAGKSTLLKLVTGLLFPSTGSIRTLGRVPGRRSPEFLSQVFVLPEELHLPAMTANEYRRARAPFYPAFDHAHFERCLDEFELPQGRPLTKLSYGQKKKFLLSFGLACRSPLLVMDEPTNGLDIPSKGQFRRMIAGAATPERLFIVSTHQVRDVESLIDPLVILHAGRVLFHQSMGEIAARIHMRHGPMAPDPAARGLLYSEPAVGGYWTVWEGGGDDRIDLEVLFNAVMARPELGRTVFAAQGEAA